MSRRGKRDGVSNLICLTPFPQCAAAYSPSLRSDLSGLPFFFHLLCSPAGDRMPDTLKEGKEKTWEQRKNGKHNILTTATPFFLILSIHSHCPFHCQHLFVPHSRIPDETGPMYVEQVNFKPHMEKTLAKICPIPEWLSIDSDTN